MSKLIMIDAGHGLKTSGKRCMKALDPNETREWYLNDRIADRVEVLLSEYDCKVLRADDTTGANDISLASRVREANNHNVDFYLSIHHNAGLSGRAGGGTEVYYSSSSKERANQAMELYKTVVAKTGLVGNRSTKTVNRGFYVIKYTKMPALLIENGFMDSPTDVPIILSAAHAEKSAQGIAEFLVNTLSLTKKVGTPAPTPVTPTNEQFIVKCLDDLNIRKSPGGAIVQKNGCKKGNKYTIVETSGNWGRLKSGAGWISIHHKYVERV